MWIRIFRFSFARNKSCFKKALNKDQTCRYKTVTAKAISLAGWKHIIINLF
jgi:hypothetical protein